MKRSPLALLFVVPSVAFAAGATTFREAADVFIDILQGISLILLMAMGVGLIYSLFWYFAHGDDEQAREKYRSYMLWSIIGVIVTFGLWGILTLTTSSLGDTFGIPVLGRPSP
ncbi:MAG TPA: hypothetical protein VLB83_05600 [Candidatus Paceibacterota bacterium]|nr:hypothetical protein [Candidatus Paceibacterota bacterium]